MLVRHALIERETLWRMAPAHHLADAFRAAASPGAEAGLAAAARTVPLRPSRRPQASAADAHVAARRRSRRRAAQGRRAHRLRILGLRHAGQPARRAERARRRRSRRRNSHARYAGRRATRRRAMAARLAPGRRRRAAKPSRRAPRQRDGAVGRFDARIGLTCRRVCKSAAGAGLAYRRAQAL